MSTAQSHEHLWIRDQMLDASIDCIKLIDADGMVLHMNRAGCVALGVTPEQQRAGFGMPWLGLLVPEVRGRGRRALRRAARGKVARFAGRSRSGGVVQEWDNLLTPLVSESGAVSAILCVSRDVSQQRQAEAQMREARDAAEVARRELALLHDVADCANRAATLDEGLMLVRHVLAERAGWEVLDGASGPERVLDDLRRRVEENGDVELVRLADGSAVTAVPIDGPDGIAHVLTVRIPSEALHPGESGYVGKTMLRVAQQLGRVVEREHDAAALAQARDVALRAAQDKATFLAVMSHELRTPMNGVIGLGELLLRSPLDPHQRRVAETMQEAGRALTSIVGDVLELTRLESRRIELREEVFDVRRAVEGAARLCAPDAHAKGIDLVTSIDPSVPRRLSGDGARLAQIVTNLCGNAVKFTESGEVVLQLGLGASEGPTASIELRVADTGPGVAEDHVDRLFEPFVQEQDSVGSRAGSGLGLAIARQLAEAMGGTVRLESTNERGSVFAASIPFTLVDRQDATSTALRGQRVLIAEDRPSARAALVATVSAWGAEVATAASHAELAVAWEARPWHRVIVSSGLPGLELGDLAADPAAERVVLVVPGLGSPAELEATRLGLDTVPSPVAVAELELLLGARAPEAAVPEAATPRLASRLRVLVVDDDRTNRMVAAGLLDALGCSTIAVADGMEALTWLTTHRDEADAVLMDCRMPTMDGDEVTRRMRREGLTIPILGCTADSSASMRERCLAAGMDDVLLKPLRTRDLAAALGAVEASAESRPSVLSLSSLLDAARVAELVAVGEEVFDGTRKLFLDRLAGRIDALAEAPDADAGSRTAHSLVGAAANVGLPQLASAARRLEQLFLSGDLGSVAGAIRELREVSALSATALRAAEPHRVR